MLKYLVKGAYAANFISPFSANDDTMLVAPIYPTSILSDDATLFELDVYQFIMTGEAYFKRNMTGNVPQIIGLDRSTV